MSDGPSLFDPVVAFNFYKGAFSSSSEFFGWGVLVLISASELEAQPAKGERRDESSDETLGI